MQLSRVKEQDIVLVDIRGQRFYAVVTGKLDRQLGIDPLLPGYNYRTATARQVRGIYRKVKGSA
jgi:hypothetical protein